MALIYRRTGTEFSVSPFDVNVHIYTLAREPPNCSLRCFKIFLIFGGYGKYSEFGVCLRAQGDDDRYFLMMIFYRRLVPNSPKTLLGLK